MKINRQDFLNDLRMVQAGLSTKELLEQSSSFVFKDKTVFTFNDEIACRKPTVLDFEGAVRADKLLKILDKLPEDDKILEVFENDKGQLEFRGRNKRFAFAREEELLLPIEKILEEVPKAWGRLPSNFAEIIDRVKGCVSTDEANHFALTCIHFHPDYIEACDTRQVLRWKTSLKNKTAMLIRGSAIGHIVGLGVSEISATASWIHFRHANGLIFSARKFIEDYPSLDDALIVKGSPVKLPKAVIKSTELAAIFAIDVVQGIEPVVTVTLKPGKIYIKGEGGLIGQGNEADVYEEAKQCSYNGPELRFVMTPKLLQHITDTYNDAQVTESKLKASGGSKDKLGMWDYVTVLGKIKPAEPIESEEAAEEEVPPEEEAEEIPDTEPEEDDVPF